MPAGAGSGQRHAAEQVSGSPGRLGAALTLLTGTAAGWLTVGPAPAHVVGTDNLPTEAALRKPAEASSGSQSAMRCVRAMRYLPFTDERGVKRQATQTRSGRFALGSLAIQRLPIQTAWPHPWFADNRPYSRAQPCSLTGWEPHWRLTVLD